MIASLAGVNCSEELREDGVVEGCGTLDVLHLLSLVAQPAPPTLELRIELELPPKLTSRFKFGF